jgi:hypothetical protein
MFRFALVLAVAACSKPADESEAKTWPLQPPPASRTVEPRKDLSIGVVVDGAAKPAITAEQLKATKPDFVDTDRRAWRIPTLVTGTKAYAVEAIGADGISVKFPAPTADLEPVLFLTRRGDVMASAVDPKDPFPAHHGQGGRLHRPGDSLPRVMQVAKLELKKPTP